MGTLFTPPRSQTDVRPRAALGAPPGRGSSTKRAPRGRPFRSEPARSLCLRRALRHDADLIVHDLEEPALDAEACARAEPKIAFAEQGHHRCMPAEDAHLAVERRGDDGIRRPLEQHRFRRDDRDGQHDQPCSFLAFSTTSSMPPAMKNACSGRLSNSPATRRSNELIVSSSFTYLPGMPVNCSATEKGCDMKRCRRRARPTIFLSSSESSSLPRMAMMSWSSL